MKRFFPFVEQARLKIKTLQPFFPAIAFFSGFTWDSITMGRRVTTVDLAILSCYYLGACTAMILKSRTINPQWQKWLTLILQFFFGGLFSALVVFYFKSSGSTLTAFFVAGLGIMLITNEFLGRKYEKQALTWTIFTLCSVMFLNFLIPHLVHSIKPIWFYLSCFLSIAIVHGIRWFAHAERQHINLPTGRTIYYRADLKYMVFPAAVLILLVVLYQQQIIPPVPLVLKETYICTDLQKSSASYQCQEEKQPFSRYLGIGQHTLHFSPGDKIYNLSAVYAPNNIRVELEQRWYWQEPIFKEWRTRGVIPVAMIGGRQNGWRIYSYIKSTVQSGTWKVETAVRGGAILAKKIFVLEEQDDVEREQKTVTIQ